MTSGNPSSADECLSVVIEAYKVYQDTQKHPESTTKIDNQADPDDVTHQRLLADAYHKYTCLVGKPSISTSASPQLSPTQLNEVLEQAIKFCQQYITQKKQAAAHSSKSSSSATSSISGGGGGKSKTPEPPKDHTDVARVDSSEAAANHVKELSLTSPKKATEEKPEEKRTLTPSTSSTHHTNGQEGLTMVEKDGRQYTRIAPPSRTSQNTLTQSPQSAFTSTHKEGERDNKRIKMDPKLGHLVIPTKDVSSRGKLVRSTSVPVTNAGMLQCFTEDSSNSENKPPVQHRHRLIARTSSSVSDYTKIKLKLSILAKTSASLVRKPSITDQEMMQITNDPDAEESSSGSEDEDEMGDGNDWRGKRKFSEEPTPSLGVNPGITSQLSPINSVVITTAGST
uniref:Uncharacterized protein n=1 Tax=Ciona savignyi TaxID=51511 RepID=H2Z7K8_CIOSA